MARQSVSAKKYRVPQNKSECDDMIARLNTLQTDIKEEEVAKERAIELVKSTSKKRAQPMHDEVEELINGIQDYCSSNREKLTKNGKTKSYKFFHGTIGWRTRPSKVSLRGIPEILETLKKKKLTDFIRTTHEVDKEAILKSPSKVKDVKGIKVGSEGEDFYIEPRETKPANSNLIG